MQPSDGAPKARAVRRDSLENRQRLIEVAIRTIARDGAQVPLAVIAAEAGLGVATFYRSFPDRAALMQELETRAYVALNRIIEAIDSEGIVGVDAIERFLTDSIAMSDRLILPLHGAPPLTDSASIAERDQIHAGLARFIGQAREAGSIVSDVNSTDVIMYAAIVSRPLQYGPDWQRGARRQVALFIAGLGASTELPGPPVSQADLEEAFVTRSRP